MSPSENCLNLIKEQEGCILHPYTDQAGVPTIGWGTTMYPSGRHVTMLDLAISQTTADIYLQYRVQLTGDAVSAMLPAGMNVNQFDALVDFAYNVGTGALHGSTVLRLIRVNRNDPAIRGALAMWDKITVDGKLILCEDLVKRRAKEADLYFAPVN